MTVFHTSGKLIFIYLLGSSSIFGNYNGYKIQFFSFKYPLPIAGVVSSAGGVTRLRKISDLRKTLEATNDAFDAAMEMAANREGPQSKLSHDEYLFTTRF